MEDQKMEQLENEFGKLFVEKFDYALDQLGRRLHSQAHESQIKFQDYLKSLTEDEKLIAVAQRALESFAHDLLFAIEDNSKFKLVTINEDGKLSILKAIGTEGLHSAQLNWREEFSKYGLLEDKIDAFAKK